MTGRRPDDIQQSLDQRLNRCWNKYRRRPRFCPTQAFAPRLPITRSLPRAAADVRAATMLKHDERAHSCAIATRYRWSHRCAGLTGGGGAIFGDRD
jgi:hypothetical protein